MLVRPYLPLTMTTLKGLRPTATAAQPGHNPVGVVKYRPSLPRVARPSQPWALLRNPFGILSSNLCRNRGVRHRLLTTLKTKRFQEGVNRPGPSEEFFNGDVYVARVAGFVNLF